MSMMKMKFTFEKQDEHTSIVNGIIDLDLVEEYFDVKLPVDEYETLSGFIYRSTRQDSRGRGEV